MHQNRAILCGCDGVFYSSPNNGATCRGPEMRDFRCEESRKRTALSSATKPGQMVFVAEFLAIPSSAVKLASERRCAILVHSAGGWLLGFRGVSLAPGCFGGSILGVFSQVCQGVVQARLRFQDTFPFVCIGSGK